MFLVPTALMLGFLHGLGADHLMAVAALAVAPADPGVSRTGRALRVAVHFAAGHALFLALGAGAVIALGWTVPAIVERSGELLGGVLLVGLGGITLWALRRGWLYGHVHPDDADLPTWHLHVGSPDRHPRLSAHAQMPMLLGALFGISSLRTLTLLTPFGDARPVVETSVGFTLALIVVFGVGILIAMTLFGILLAKLMSTRRAMALSRVAAGVTALASVGVGLYWILWRAS